MESVQVALRIRPLLENEIIMGCQKCIDRIPNEPQVRVGKANTSYTFNYVFDEFEGQNKVYDVAIKKLTEKLFEGKITFLYLKNMSIICFLLFSVFISLFIIS